MIRKKKFSGVQLYAYELQCNHCNYPNVLFLGNREQDIIGTECGNCCNRLWFNNRKNSILEKLSASDGPVFGEEYIKWKSSIEQEFYDSLPSCNVCGVGKFTKLVTNVPDKPIICQNCHQHISNSKWVNVSDRYKDTEVYWYEESDEKRNIIHVDMT